MITEIQYFGAKLEHPDCTPARRENAGRFLGRLNAFLDYARAQGRYHDRVDPDTGTCISGSKGGAGDGGFRLQGATTGRTKSGHKEGNAGDVFDPVDELDDWITEFDRETEGTVKNELLERFELYREHPDHTKGWAHLQDVPPKSGKRTYIP